jgi:hypothetical protein
MKISTFLYITCAMSIIGCSAPDPDKPSDRSTFIKVYEGPNGYTAAAIDKQPNGYVILANSVDDNNDEKMVIFETDFSGNRTSASVYIEGGSGMGIKTLSKGGYVIVANSTVEELNPVDANDFKIISSKVIILDASLNEVQTIIKTDDVNPEGKIDFETNAVTTVGENKIIVLGTYHKTENTPVKPYILTLEDDGTGYKEIWYKTFDLLDKDYQNAKSVFYSNSKIIWASAVAQEQQNFNFSYVNIPLIEEGSVFSNYNLLGETTEQLLIANDICASQLDQSGYGVIGTYGTTTQGDKNIVFLRVNNQGNISQESIHYYDAVSGVTESSASLTEDTGEAIGSTSDGGFVLGGSMLSTPEKGNGGREVLLIKIDAIGNLVWSKTLGGVGDELVEGILETDDQGILVFGTNTIGGFPSIFLMKTDSNGELKK